MRVHYCTTYLHHDYSVRDVASDIPHDVSALVRCASTSSEGLARPRLRLLRISDAYAAIALGLYVTDRRVRISLRLHCASSIARLVTTVRRSGALRYITVQPTVAAHYIEHRQRSTSVTAAAAFC